MKIGKHFTSVIFILLILLLLPTMLFAAPSDLVYVVKVEGEIEPGLAMFIEKTLKDAENAGAKAVVLEINTFGGLVDSAVKIRDLLLDSPVLTAALVKDRAWSAGALITLACDKIYMTPESSMGAAETRPKEEKYISAFRKEFKATAEKQGRNPDLAAAMVDADIEIPAVIEKGKLLTLTAAEAVQLQMADKQVNSYKDVVADLGAADGVVELIQPGLADRFARFVTHPYVSALLISIGFIGIVVEAMTLGWGIGGTVGILALSVFFSGNLLVGNTSWGLILLFIAGMILLAIELFVIPGFGVTGVAGIALALTSLFLTFENPTLGMYAISFALILAIATLIVMFRFFGQSKAWSKIALQTTQTKENGYLAPTIRMDLIGAEGEAYTVLRPAGTALFGGERVDVVTDGEFILKGSKIKVIKVEGTRVVVREV